jgi:hypothetical protein
MEGAGLASILFYLSGPHFTTRRVEISRNVQAVLTSQPVVPAIKICYSEGELPAQNCSRDLGSIMAALIVLTQACDCDLGQTKTTKVLLGWVHSVEDLVRHGVVKGPAIRDQRRRGKENLMTGHTRRSVAVEYRIGRRRRPACGHPGHCDCNESRQPTGYGRPR